MGSVSCTAFPPRRRRTLPAATVWVTAAEVVLEAEVELAVVWADADEAASKMEARARRARRREVAVIVQQRVGR